jgi:photosystem II stability/assembly factor-like uncharacterized protein
MSDDQITELLERAAETYTPDDNGAVLSAVKSRGRRRARIRKFEVGVAALALAVLGAAIVAWISVGGERGGSQSGHYLSISSLSRLVSDSAQATGVSTDNAIVDPYFANARQGIALRSDCVLSTAPPRDTSCTLAVVRSDDGGATWKAVGQHLRVTYPNSRASYPFIDFTTNGKDGWIYGDETFVTHDGGTTLTRDSLVGLVSNLSIVGGNVWALVRPCPPSDPACGSRLYSASVRGGSWDIVTSAPALTYPYLSLLRPSVNRAYLAAQANAGLLYSTKDGGSSWDHHSLPPLCGQLLRLSADTHDDLWALCLSASATNRQTKELYRSRDSGAAWSLVATTPSEGFVAGSLPTSGIVSSFTSVGRDELVVTLVRGPVYVSHDGGKNWTESDLPGGNLQQLTFSNPLTGSAILYSGEVYRTSDGGIHWTLARPQSRRPTSTPAR